MPYAPPLITNKVCAHGCISNPGNVLELRGPQQHGLTEELWDSKPSGHRAYHCVRCGFVWFKHPRRVGEPIAVGFWNPGSKTFTPS